MSTNAHRVADNIAWNLQIMVPTLANRKRFRQYDPWDLEPGDQSGEIRAFYVEWSGSSEDVEPTDLFDRVSDHEYEIRIKYPTIDSSYQNLQRVILQDRHDINNTLRNPDLWVGYSKTQTTADIGLWNRKRIGDEIVRDDDSWEFVSRWLCVIQEVE